MSSVRSVAVCMVAIAFPIAISAQMSPRAGGHIDLERSTLTVHVFRSGIFAFAGDNHEVRVPITEGSVQAANESVELTMDAKKMQVLDPNLSAEKRTEVQKNMLGPEVLDTDRFPQIKFRSTKIEALGKNGFQVSGTLTLHGVSKPIVVMVVGAGTHYRGSTTLKQTVFGIKPISVGGGTVKVKDEVKIDFDIVIHP